VNFTGKYGAVKYMKPYVQNLLFETVSLPFLAFFSLTFGWLGVLLLLLLQISDLGPVVQSLHGLA
jgi:hypothetical protein